MRMPAAVATCFHHRSISRLDWRWLRVYSGHNAKVMKIAVGEAEDLPPNTGKNKAAQELGKNGYQHQHRRKEVREPCAHGRYLDGLVQLGSHSQKPSVTPAKAAGQTDRLWTWDEIIDGMDAISPKPGRPKTYQKRGEENSN